MVDMFMLLFFGHTEFEFRINYRIYYKYCYTRNELSLLKIINSMVGVGNKTTSRNVFEEFDDVQLFHFKAEFKLRIEDEVIGLYTPLQKPYREINNVCV
ncbi:MAG TPA: hypothetical protein VIH86_00810 [Puia sp.]